MKIRISKKLTWDSSKCVPLQVLKYGVIAGMVYAIYILGYYALLPFSTM